MTPSHSTPFSISSAPAHQRTHRGFVATRGEKARTNSFATDHRVRSSLKVVEFYPPEFGGQVCEGPRSLPVSPSRINGPSAVYHLFSVCPLVPHLRSSVQSASVAAVRQEQL